MVLNTTQDIEDLIKKYNIETGLFNRYFKQNAQRRYGVELLKFLLFKQGKFLNPTKKIAQINKYLIQEIENFYEKGEINIPYLVFCLTTRCTLKCKDCNELIPLFNKNNLVDTNFDEFKYNIDKLCNISKSIRCLSLIGGETLLCPDLPKMVEYACQKDNIDIVMIVTNGTMLPSKNLLNVLKKYNNRVYVYISNYSTSKVVKPMLKHEKIMKALKNNNIKFQIVQDFVWAKEYGFSSQKASNQQTEIKFSKCFCSHCTQVSNSKLCVCTKASSGIELGLINFNDYIDLEKTTDLRKDLIGFYKKDYMQACEYCIINEGTVTPALQIGD